MTPHRVDIQMVAGEDFSAMIEWTDSAGTPIVTAGRARLSVFSKATGSILLDFDSDHTEGTEAHVAPLPGTGIVKMTCPSAVSGTVPVGRHDFDLVVHVPDDDSPFAGQEQRRYVLTGDFVVSGKHTTI